MKKVEFPYAELRTVARRLEMPIQSELAEQDGELVGRRCAEAYAPIMKTGVDLSAVPKSMHEMYRNAIGFAIHQTIKHTRKAEATLAGVALPVFTKQKIAMIMRAYPKLVAPQLVGFFPMQGPTALIGYTVAKYDDNYTASSPTIAQGDEINDPTKANKGFTTVAEGGQAKKVTRTIARQTITATTHRDIAEWSQDLVEDGQNEWDVDMPSQLILDAADVMGQSLEVEVIDACSTDAPVAAQTSFNMRPSASPDYSTLSPSEQREWRELLIKDGAVACINKINRANHFGEGSPNWGLCSPNAGQALEGVRGFTAVQTAPDEYGIATGAVRYIGNLNSVAGGVRLFVSEFYNRGETTTGKILFGRKPDSILGPGIRVGMYVPLQLTNELYDPNTDLFVKGLRSRYAVARKDNSVADSAQLVRTYGELTITI